MKTAIRTLAALLALSPYLVPIHADGVTVKVDTPMVPPEWALLERQLLRANTEACREFFSRYFDERGYLECVERWGGDDVSVPTEMVTEYVVCATAPKAEPGLQALTVARRYIKRRCLPLCRLLERGLCCCSGSARAVD